MCKIAVICKHEEAGCLIVQPANRLKAYARYTDQPANVWTAKLIAAGGDIAGRFIEHNGYLRLPVFYPSPAQAHLIAPGINLAAQLRNNLTIYLYQTGYNPLFTFSSGAASAPSQIFLQTFHSILPKVFSSALSSATTETYPATFPSTQTAASPSVCPSSTGACTT